MAEKRVEQLYDEYLDAALAGDPPSPYLFLSRLGVKDDALLRRLEQLHQESKQAQPANGKSVSRPADGAAEHVGQSDDPSGQILGGFRLIRRLGEGGMGIVYLAEQTAMERSVALKVIRPEFARSSSAAKRFEREAKAVARLRHPNIVTVYAVGEDRGIRYIAMEYVQGRTLSELLKESGDGKDRPSTATIVRWIAMLARALHYAHERGIVHRDVKPSNIVIADGRPLLLDFGLARDLHSQQVTITEQFIGSPQYVAPEQIGRAGGKVDGRADQYSLGVVLYECLAGRIPFNAGSIEQVFHAILSDDPPTPRSLRKAVPRDLDVIVMKAIEKEPRRRYSNLEEMADDLEAVLEFRPIRARPPGLVLRSWKWLRRRPMAAAALLLMFAVAMTLAIQQSQQYRERRLATHEAIAEATQLIAAYQQSREETEALEQRYENLRRFQLSNYFTEEEDRILAEAEDEVLNARNERERMYNRALNLLDRAERLSARRFEDVQQLRGELYLARYLDALLANDRAEQAIYFDLVQRYDPDGRLTDQVAAGAAVSIVTDPPGAELFLFRMTELYELVPGGERRMVPVAWGERALREGAESQHTLQAGQWALRVVHGVGEIRQGDLIVELAGHVIRDIALVSEVKSAAGSAHPVRRLDRLVSINGEAVRGDYEVQTLGNVEASQTDGGDNQLHRFEFERHGETFIVEGVSLVDLGIKAAGPRSVAEQGDAPALLWQDGQLREVNLPAGLSVRTTAAPAFISPEARQGTSPITGCQLESGWYLLVARKEGCDEKRYPLHIERGRQVHLDLRLLPEGTTEAGWVYVPLWRAEYASRIKTAGLTNFVPDEEEIGSQAVNGFWIMEREVTLHEYAEFLNDPEIMAKIDGSPVPMLYPRPSGYSMNERDSEGRIMLVSGWSWEWPVLGVSWNDAQAYAKWKTSSAQDAGLPVVYALPTHDHWKLASGSRRHFVFGDRFHPKWVSSCFARPTPAPEPPMRFPVDESILGVYDMSGSMSEWLDDWWMEESGLRRHAGGSWGDGGPESIFRVEGGNGQRPDVAAGQYGFRLIKFRVKPDEDDIEQVSGVRCQVTGSQSNQQVH